MSPEYQATHRGDVSFVNGLYAQILNRPADPDGRSTWFEALQNGLSQLELVQVFLTCPEVNQQAVDQYYALFLNRRPDGGGEQLWTNLLRTSRATFKSVGEAILASDEYFARPAS
jgi:hypothetical protein